MSNYSELMVLQPDYYKEFIEMKEYLKSLGRELDEAEKSRISVLMNNYIYDADEQTIERLEKYLYLPGIKAKSLEDRKRLVASFFVGSGKLSGTSIKDMVFQFTNATPSVFLTVGAINVEVDRGTTMSLYLGDVITVLERRIPAHLELRLSIKFKHQINLGFNMKVFKFDYVRCNQILCGTYPS